jgi:hypothetical protein
MRSPPQRKPGTSSWLGILITIANLLVLGIVFFTRGDERARAGPKVAPKAPLARDRSLDPVFPVVSSAAAPSVAAPVRKIPATVARKATPPIDDIRGTEIESTAPSSKPSHGRFQLTNLDPKEKYRLLAGGNGTLWLSPVIARAGDRVELAVVPLRISRLQLSPEVPGDWTEEMFASLHLSFWHKKEGVIPMELSNMQQRVVGVPEEWSTGLAANERLYFFVAPNFRGQSPVRALEVECSIRGSSKRPLEPASFLA